MAREYYAWRSERHILMAAANTICAFKKTWYYLFIDSWHIEDTNMNTMECSHSSNWHQFDWIMNNFQKLGIRHRQIVRISEAVLQAKASLFCLKQFEIPEYVLSLTSKWGFDSSPLAQEATTVPENSVALEKIWISVGLWHNANIWWNLVLNT